MYAAIDDPYYYPVITVLINRLGLQSQRELDAFWQPPGRRFDVALDQTKLCGV